MKYGRVLKWMLIAGLALAIPLSEVSEGQGLQPGTVGKPKDPTTGGGTQEIKYNPPSVGAPVGRVGGGTRGSGDVSTLSVLAPPHVGLTGQEQPVLYWYLAQATTYPIELTVRDEQTPQPFLETHLGSFARPGIQRVRLADYGVRLMPGVRYRWAVALVPNPGYRSKDIVAEGAIEYKQLPAALQTQLTQTHEAQAPSLYAEAGFWYDALAAISDLIDAVPEDLLLRQQRAALLEQVGLSEVAMYDVQSGK